MTEVTIPFGGAPYTFDAPEQNLAEVLSPRHTEPVADLELEIHRALDNPIGQKTFSQWIKPSDRILIVSDDNTRSTPARQIIQALLRRLNNAGLPDAQISCLMALGTHRYMTEAEMIEKVGPEIFNRLKVFNHEWRNPDALVDLGATRRGTPLVVNKAVLDAEVVIGLGAVVPHHIPGYSGSSKIIQPGICGAGTTAATHFLACSGGGDSFLGLEYNPVREDMDDMAERIGLKSIINVVQNSEGRVVGVFCGEMRAAFKEAARLARKIYGVRYHEPPDVVLTNSHPCDLDFWQAHKSLYPAQRMIRKGGTIIVCTPAPEGISPVHTDLTRFTSWPSHKIRAAYQQGELRNGVAASLAVAWAMAREKAEIIMYSPGISSNDKALLGHTHAPGLEWAVKEALRRQGPEARLTVLTHAPDMLPIKAFSS